MTGYWLSDWERAVIAESVEKCAHSYDAKSVQALLEKLNHASHIRVTIPNDAPKHLVYKSDVI
jgi:hypothetical protein